MSYTARPSFVGGMSNQNQQQQQGGQPNNSNIGASGIPNLPMMNNAAAIPGNHLGNPSSSPALSMMEQQKLLQQQILLQRQLINQQFQQQQQQQQQSSQQAKFQQQPNQQQAFTRIMSEMLNDKNGSNVAQQSQHLQQIVQLQALSNMMQLQQQAAQQKSFQQQSVPLPTNTTITPVARQNTQSVPKQPVNYPRSNVHNKNVSQNVSSSPMQSRKSFPNAPKSTVPQMQSGMVATPLNIPGGSSKSTLPQIPLVMASATATNSSKGYADFISLTNAQSSMNITPSLTITKSKMTKTSSPSASASLAKHGSNLVNLPISSSNATAQKSFLPEAIQMSLGNVPLSVKATQPPSVTVTPTNKPTSSPTNKTIPITPQKTIPPPNIPFLQKLSPTSPRTKQTPRKNTNKTRTASLSPATQISPPTVVPQVDAKAPNTSVPNSSSATKPAVSSPVVANANSVKPPSVNVVPATSPKPNVASTGNVAAVTAQTPPKLVQSAPANNSNAAGKKPPAATPKIETPPVPALAKCGVAPAKQAKEIAKKDGAEDGSKAETPEKAINAKPVEAAKVEKTLASPSAAATATTANASQEPKSKLNTSQSTSASNKTNQTVTPKQKDNKESITSSPAKLKTDSTSKTPVAKIAKAAPVAPARPTTSAASATPATPTEGRVKRNRSVSEPNA